MSLPLVEVPIPYHNFVITLWLLAWWGLRIWLRRAHV